MKQWLFYKKSDMVCYSTICFRYVMNLSQSEIAFLNISFDVAAISFTPKRKRIRGSFNRFLSPCLRKGERNWKGSVNISNKLIQIESMIVRKKERAYAMKRVAAGAHLPTPWRFEPEKRPDNRDYQCVYFNFLLVQTSGNCFTVKWVVARPESRTVVGARPSKHSQGTWPLSSAD